MEACYKEFVCVENASCAEPVTDEGRATWTAKAPSWNKFTYIDLMILMLMLIKVSTKNSPPFETFGRKMRTNRRRKREK